MSRSSDETRIDQARVARDEARALFRADMTVLRESLAERPLTQRLRDRVIHAAADAFEAGLGLARENIVAIGLTASGIAGWVFRKPLGRLAQTVRNRLGRVFARKSR
ncbi:hypothetical protein Y88_0908 [Novosphingobium nitrogenifigens DSM 19370]|uniref:DUF3618 domain-containing protein n=1 Tax=Novosphingobium nitrogenifigens DSM 19370 TaxID=983920 RepID=F1Z8Z2_9SPHN|nr:hypothetical protein [Novosphingobium nitrogenifigens]EGD58847.1 hypothetical protein Y88_0908 [Novosphingobium nitrogenifigens DSM 19370]